MNVIHLNNKSTKLMGIGNNLKKIVREKGIKGIDLSKEMQLAAETVSRHMNPKTQISMKYAHRYAEILEVDPEDIYRTQVPLELIGQLQEDMHIDLYSKRERFELIGPINYPANYQGIRIFNYFAPHEESVLIFDGETKAIKRMGSLSILRYRMKNGKENTVLGFPFEQGWGEYNIRVSQAMFQRVQWEGKRKKLAEMWIKDIELLWASPVLTSVYLPSDMDCEIIEQ